MAKPKPSDALRAAVWSSPDDVKVLRVWADQLLEAGDPRGELIQLKTTPRANPEQLEKIHELERKLGRKRDSPLVGPAARFLRHWTFGPVGLIDMVKCEAPRLGAGFDEILDLSPRLEVRVTSLSKKKKATLKAFAALPLSRIYSLHLGSNDLSDDDLKQLAPALKGVRNLHLANNPITPAAIKVLEANAGSLDLLCIDAESPKLADAWVEACGQLPNLEVLCFYRSGLPKRGHKRVRTVTTEWPPDVEAVGLMVSGAKPPKVEGDFSYIATKNRKDLGVRWRDL